ncbi:MAG: hypothetical protein GXO54_01660 [Chloroflexi bacterium]|nr:hypothetical protein [Chloroflexota bacterium]
MRLTPKRLLGWAQDYVASRTRDLNLLAVYLTGSLLTEEPLFGGLTDIDVVCIYNLEPPQTHEIRPLVRGVHLDVRHYPRDRFEPPRRLRHEAEMGSEVYYAQPLWDPQHFLDFVQSGVRSRFHSPDVAYARAWAALNQARQQWQQLLFAADPNEPDTWLQHLESLRQATLAIATLQGRRLTLRRFTLQWATEAALLAREDWFSALLRALGAHDGLAQTIMSLRDDWSRSLTLVAQAAPEHLHPARVPYYQTGLDALLSNNPPEQALYLLWWTWSDAVRHPQAPEEARTRWLDAQTRLGLDAAWTSLLDASDAFLDEVEQYLESWGRAQGVE